jgi:hypothetical protein
MWQFIIEIFQSSEFRSTSFAETLLDGYHLHEKDPS